MGESAIIIIVAGMGVISSLVITLLSCGIIILIFSNFFSELNLFEDGSGLIEKAIQDVKKGKGISLPSLKSSKLSEIAKQYISSVSISTPSGQKTNIPASEFFSVQSVGKAYGVNLQKLDTASSTLVGLGLLGTFLGLTIGILGADLTNRANIEKSIQGLLGGMSTAFATSLVGMSLSLVYTAFDKKWRNMLTNSLYELTEMLDQLFYIDDVELTKQNNQKMFDSMFANLNRILSVQTTEITRQIETVAQQHLEYTDEAGQQVRIGNAFREMLTENQQQTKALKAFSSDLSMNFENIMEGLNSSTASLAEHIDQMSGNVGSPVTNLVEKMVDELKTSMVTVINEFKHGLSESTTDELTEITKALAHATESMNTFPNQMQNISDMLTSSIEGAKNVIGEISRVSASTNAAAMQAMKEQITNAVSSMDNAIANVKEVMEQVSQTSQTMNQNMLGQMSSVTTQMGESINTSIDKMTQTVSHRVEDITGKVADMQTDLLALHDETIQKTCDLLTRFNDSIDKMDEASEGLADTMDSFRQVQAQIFGCTSHMQIVAEELKTAATDFQQTQNDYSRRLDEYHEKSEQLLGSVSAVLRESGDMSKGYVNDFSVIQQGLTSIFGQIQTGLEQYSKTVETSINSYLDQFSSALTQAAGQLNSAINMLQEVVDNLSESISNSKR